MANQNQVILNKFTQKVKDEWHELLPSLKKEALKKFRENKLTIDFKNKEIIGLPNNLKFGIYLFLIIPNKTFSVSNFKKEWVKDKAIKKTPKVISSRFNEKDTFEKPYKLYIGKSEKLTSRIKQHCFQDKNKTTYSLKLLHRKALLKNCEIKVCYYIIEAEKKDKNIIQFILTNLEENLRKELNPWVGKQ